MDNDQANTGPLHVFDLPQVYQRPGASAMLRALDLLAFDAPSFSSSTALQTHQRPSVESAGVPEYLTRIIASPLAWIDDEQARDDIWELAGRRLTERSGRSGMSAMTRPFTIPISSRQSEHITIHEPALTGDNLGLKTWGSAYVLARHLHRLDIGPLLSQQHAQRSQSGDMEQPQVLELGSGTGLVGLAAAAAWNTHVLLTDLPAIVPNLQHNAALNAEIVQSNSGETSTAVLDWSQPKATIKVTHDRSKGRYDLDPRSCKFEVIIAADPIYDPAHPRMLVAAIEQWLGRSDECDARVLVAYPLRDAYEPQIRELKQRLADLGLRAMLEAKERSMDDWKDEVVFEWAVWTWRDR